MFFDDEDSPHRHLPFHRRMWLAITSRLAKLGTDCLDRLEWTLHRCVAGLTWLVTKPLSILFPWKLLGRLALVWHVFWLRVFQSLGRLADRVVPHWLLAGVYRLFAWMGAVASAGVEFCRAWWYSRDFRKLLAAIPALLLAMPLAVCLAMIPLHSNDKKIQRYRLALQEAVSADDRVRQELYLRRLTQLGDRLIDRGEFQAAAALAADEDYEQAYQRMRKLAPVNTPGFAQAHLWIAGSLANRDIDIEEPERWKLIETHARHTLATDRDNPYARRLLAHVDIHHGRVSQATEALESLVKDYPDLDWIRHLNWTLLNLYRASGDDGAVARKARKAVTFFERLDEDDYDLKDEDFLQWADALALLSDPSVTQAILERGNLKFPGDANLTNALVKVILLRHHQLDPATREAKPLTIELLVRAYKLAPHDQEVTRRLAKYLYESEETVRPYVEKLNMQEAHSPEVFLKAGDYAIVSQDFPTALRWYRQSCVIDPQCARGWNNLGWILGNVEPVQLSDALAAVNRAIEAGSTSRYLETRGQILFEMQRWEEAVRDLEQALNGDLPAEAAAHESLAKAYEMLGNVEQAAAHRERSKAVE